MDTNLDLTIRVPSNKINDDKYLEYVVQNTGNLEEELREYIVESPIRIKVNRVKLLSKVNRTKMFSKKKISRRLRRLNH